VPVNRKDHIALRKPGSGGGAVYGQVGDEPALHSGQAENLRQLRRQFLDACA